VISIGAALYSKQRNITAQILVFFGGIRGMEGVDAAYEQVTEQVAELRAQLEEKERELQTLEIIKQVRAGTFRPHEAPAPPRRRSTSGTGTRPRGETANRIMELLSRNTDGLTRGAIIERLGAKGDKSAEASISNSLVSLKRASRIGHNTESGVYTAA